VLHVRPAYEGHAQRLAHGQDDGDVDGGALRFGQDGCHRLRLDGRGGADGALREGLDRHRPVTGRERQGGG
jgi:hypothetical protein